MPGTVVQEGAHLRWTFDSARVGTDNSVRVLRNGTQVAYFDAASPGGSSFTVSGLDTDVSPSVDYTYRAVYYSQQYAQGVVTKDESVTGRLNSAPSTPGPFSSPTSGQHTDSVTASWGASTDPDGQAVNYTLFIQTPAAGVQQVYYGPATSVTVSNLASRFGATSSAFFTVQADDGTLTSGSRQSPTFTINRPPGAPGSVTSPASGAAVNTTATVTFGAATDPDGQPLTYDTYLTTDGGNSYRLIRSNQPETSYVHDFTNEPATAAAWLHVYSRDSLGATAGPVQGPTFRIEHNRAPNAPTLTAPANGSTLDLAAGFSLSWTVNDPDGDPQASYALRRKVSGAATYEWWNASTATWQATEVFNATAATTIQYAAGKWANGSTYNWSVRTRDPGTLTGPYADDATVTGSSGPTVTVLAPAGAVTGTSRPVVTWTYAQAENSPQTAYTVKVYDATQYGAAGFNPATSTPVWTSGTVSSATARSHQVGVDLANGTQYRAYVQVVQAQGSLASGWAFLAFNLQLTTAMLPAVTATDQPANGRVQVTVDAGQDNLLTANQGSLETDVTGWAAAGNSTVARTTAQAFSGTAALQVTTTAAGDALADTHASFRPQVQPGGVYTFTAHFRAAVTPRNCRIDYHFLDAAGAAVTAYSTAAQAGDHAAGWTQVSGTLVAPAGATHVRVVLRVQGCAAGEVHYVDGISLRRNPVGNLIANSNGRTLVGWIKANAAPGALTLATDQAYVGRTSLLIATTAAGSAISLDSATFYLLAGQAYTFSAYVLRPTTGAVPTVNLRAIQSTPSLVVASTGGQATAVGVWTRLSLTFTALNSGSHYLQVLASNPGAAQSFYVDAAQAVTGTSALEYVPPTSTNLVLNPRPNGTALSSQVGTVAGTNSAGTDVTVPSGRYTRYTNSTGWGHNTAELAPGRYVYSAWWRSSDARTLSVWQEGTAGLGSLGSVTLAANTWTRVVVPFNLLAHGTTKTGWLTPGASGTTSPQVDVSSVQVEYGTAATSYDDGTMGPGYLWLAAENLLSAENASFESGTVGGWSGPNGATVANSADRAFSGTRSLLVTLPTAGSGSVGAGVNVTLAPNTVYTFSAYVYLPAGSVASTRLSVQGAGVPASVNGLPVTTTDAWVRHVLTFVSSSTGGVVQTYVLNADAATAGQTFYVDAVQVEAKDHATAYAQAGTADAAPSRRQEPFTQGFGGTQLAAKVERSTDGGLTWTTVRDGARVLYDAGQRAVVHDYETPGGQPVLYRASTLAEV